MGCYGCGELLPVLSCSCEPSVFNLIQYMGKEEELSRVVFSPMQRLSLCIIFNEINSLSGAHMLPCETGDALTHQRVITMFVPEIDGLCSSPQTGGVTMIEVTNGLFGLKDEVRGGYLGDYSLTSWGRKERREILKVLLWKECYRGWQPQQDCKGDREILWVWSQIYIRILPEDHS